MVRYIIIFLILIITSCKTSEPLIKLNKVQLETVSFDAVTKNIQFNLYEKNEFNSLGKELIYNWYNKQIKTDGLDGSLNIIVTNLETQIEKKEEYFKVTVYLSIQFNVESKMLASKKSINVSASEFSEINGKFSILDQENLSTNTFIKVLKKITTELNKN